MIEEHTQRRLIRAKDFRFMTAVLLVIPGFYILRLLLVRFGLVNGVAYDLSETIATEAGIAVVCFLVYAAIIALRLRDQRSS